MRSISCLIIFLWATNCTSAQLRSSIRCDSVFKVLTPLANLWTTERPPTPILTRKQTRNFFKIPVSGSQQCRTYLTIAVSPEGLIDCVKVAYSACPALDSLAIARVKSIRYNPASDQENPLFHC